MVEDNLGSQIRAARRARGMSLRTLAQKVGVSASMLSLLETGRSRSSVTTLFAVVEALDMSMDDLFVGEAVRPPPSPDAGEDEVVIVRRDQAPRVELETGVIWEQLGHHQPYGAELLLVTYPPGAKSSLSGKFQLHTGYELAHILHGQLFCRVRFEEFTLGEGDSVSFDSERPHLLENRGSVDVRAVWVLIGRRPGAPVTGHDLRELHQDAADFLAAAVSRQIGKGDAARKDSATRKKASEPAVAPAPSPGP
jgi:transcriptional regulator with XRE-family HTH domain